MASTFVFARGKGAVPGNHKQKTVTVTLTGTYTTGGEAITERELCGTGRRIFKAIPTIVEGNGVEATPVVAGSCEVTGGGTGIKLKLLNGKTSAQLAAGVATTGVKFEIQVTYV